ncbi:MAG TPA: transposase [Candidatus Tectomicrobia bacterium]
MLVLCPIHPLTLAKYRDAFTPSHAKDDPPDVARPRELLLTHRDQLTPLNSQRPARRALAPLVEHRRRLVGDNGRLTNRLTSALQHSGPHVLHWFDDQDTTIFCDFLAQGPPSTPCSLRVAPPLRTASAPITCATSRSSTTASAPSSAPPH